MDPFYSLILFKNNFNIIFPSTRFLPRSLWPSYFPTTTSYEFPFSPKRVTCSNYILLMYVFSLPLSTFFSHFLRLIPRLHSTPSSASSSILLSPFSVIICLLVLLRIFQLYSVLSSLFSHSVGYYFYHPPNLFCFSAFFSILFFSCLLLSIFSTFLYLYFTPRNCTFLKFLSIFVLCL